jgi:serine/threonine protein phosphatase PrpC
MGAMLSQPLTDKATEGGENDDMVFGVSSMQGYRLQMEDRHSAFVALPEEPSCAFFGVYDGHSGLCIFSPKGRVVFNRDV